MSDFDYAEYLSNLLIIQYHDRARAKATIKALGKDFPVDLIFAVRDGFSLETAVGKQLDILAKYLGTDRYYISTTGTIVSLTDQEFRILLKLKAIANNTNCSHADIDQTLYNFFGTDIRAESRGGMELTFFIPAESSRVIIAAIQKDCLPRPMGVGIRYVIVQTNPIFGFVTYDNQYAFYKTGFRDYDNPDKVGETLNYFKIIEVIGE